MGVKEGVEGAWKVVFYFCKWTLRGAPFVEGDGENRLFAVPGK